MIPVRRRFVTMAILTALLTASATAAQGSAQPAPGTLFLHPERIAFEDGGRVDAERGVLYVPLNRQKPASGVVAIEIYRFRGATGAAVSTPPIFLLHGGPGWPGLAGSLENSDYWNSTLRPLAEVADLVVVGQRGIGSSRPDTSCASPDEPPPDATVTREQRAAVIRETSERCKAFWEGRGLDLSGFTVVEAAADVDEVRRALGYGKITLWGGSFGSHWSMAILRFHPEIVARAVLTGLEGPDHTYDSPGGVLRAIERMAAAAEASGELRPHLPDDGLLAAFRELLARVEEEPVVLEVEDPESGEKRKVRFDADDVRAMATGVTGSARSRRRLPQWPGEMIELLAGDFTKAATRKLDDGGGMPTASFFMLDCGSGISAARSQALLDDPAAEVLGPINWFYREACPVWGSDLGEAFRENFETDIPVVLVHGNWDVSTPFDNALELAPYFKHGKLVVVKGGTHGALREALAEADGFREALTRFVASGDMSAVPDEVELGPIAWKVPEVESSDE